MMRSGKWLSLIDPSRRRFHAARLVLMAGLLVALTGCWPEFGGSWPGAAPSASLTPPAAPTTDEATAITRTLPPPVISAAVTPDNSGDGGEEAPPGRGGGTAFSPVVASHYAGTDCDDAGPTDEAAAPAGVSITGDLKKWHPLSLDVAGPAVDEADEDPNPFLDYRLQVHFLGPDGQSYDVPGYFAGDGQGGGAGNVWRARFSPDGVGTWRYCVSFRAGENVAVEPEAGAGLPLPPDGAAGQFVVAERDPEAPGFLKWGRLEYVGEHYRKFRDGPYWIKGGTNSPENFLGYAGFDNTYDQGGINVDFLHAYAPHVGDWREGDPNFQSADRDYDGRGIIGALNYLSEQHVNSVYFLPMNLGGDGQETYPFISPDGTPFANTHYDISKLHQWAAVLEHAQRGGISIQVVLNETEEANRHWLDGGALGPERRLFYREMVARFGHLLAVKWNISEENVFTPDEVSAFADAIRALDWAGHPIAVHNPYGWFGQHQVLLGDDRLPAMATHYDGDQAGALVEQWRRLSTNAGRPWIIDMDENGPAGVGLGPDNAGQLRKTILYDVYFSGGNLEWYAGYYELPVGGDVNLEDFRTREAMWRYTWHARRFMEENLPFWVMEPADELLSSEAEAYGGGEVFAYGDEIYAVYLPAANPSGVLRVAEGRAYWLRWYDPRAGEFAGEAVSVTAAAGGLTLGAPPDNPDGDWVVLVTATLEPGVVVPPVGYP